MPDKLKEIWQYVVNFWNKLTLAQKVLYAGTAVSIIVVLLIILIMANQKEYKVLYSNLYPEDAAQVVEILKKQKVDYKLADGGKAILVPAEKVYSLRLTIASEDVLHGQGVGFEIFDQNKIGQTDFVQRINYQRALQGELARTIMEFPEIESARVHLVLPQKSLFIEEQKTPSASVVVKLKRRRSLKKEQVQCIVNLITTGVEGMTPDHITISDTRGNVLYEPESELDKLSATQLEYQLNLQRQLERRIEQLLAPIVGGPERVIARVNADLDFSQKTIHKELYDPDTQVVRSEQKSEEKTKASANYDTNVPEPAYRGEGYGGTGTLTETNRKSTTTNYEISKEEQQIIAPIGEVRRLSVAAVVDGRYKKNEDGDLVYVPLSEQELARIEELVKNAVGFDQTRGDSIEISNLSFGMKGLEGGKTWMEQVALYFQSIGKPILNTLIILLFILLVVRPIVLAILKPKVIEEEEEVEELESLPEPEEEEEKPGLLDAFDEETLAAMEEKDMIEDQKELAIQLSNEHFDEAFGVIKRWLKEDMEEA